MNNFQILLHVDSSLSSHYKRLHFHVHTSGTDLSEHHVQRQTVTVLNDCIFSFITNFFCFVDLETLSLTLK